MDIPDTCKPWQEKMESGNNQDKKVLDNLRRDDCIKSKISDKFFKRLAAKGNSFKTEGAQKVAIDIVATDPDRFVCQGKQIPKGSFNTLCRLEDVKKLGTHLPDEHLRNFGIRDRKTLTSKELSDDELNIMVNMYKGTLNLANKLDVVWVVNNEDSKKIGLKELVNRLGLVNLENERRCLKIAYKRDIAKKNLHLPRSFDGIDNSQFEVVDNCKADAGKTIPLNSSTGQGLPEAVHRGCKVKPDIFEVEPIE
jgi:hypothetical protein